jgi:hypothetical protein
MPTEAAVGGVPEATGHEAEEAPERRVESEEDRVYRDDQGPQRVHQDADGFPRDDARDGRSMPAGYA